MRSLQYLVLGTAVSISSFACGSEMSTDTNRGEVVGPMAGVTASAESPEISVLSQALSVSAASTCRNLKYKVKTSSKGSYVDKASGECRRKDGVYVPTWYTAPAGKGCFSDLENCDGNLTCNGC